MLAAYGLDVLRPGVSHRRLQVLVDRLPAHTRTTDDPRGTWSTESYLLANVFDAVQALTYAVIRVNAPKARPTKPRPITRPVGRPPRPPERLAPAQQQAARAPAEGRMGWGDAMRKLAGTDGVRVTRG